MLTRKEKEELVLDLYFNQNKTIREVAKIARKSPRDIGDIINRAIREKERQEHKSLSVQAYELFRQGKQPIDVAITLNIAQMQVIQYHTEYLRLIQHNAVNHTSRAWRQHRSLSRIYTEHRSLRIWVYNKSLTFLSSPTIICH